MVTKRTMALLLSPLLLFPVLLVPYSLVNQAFLVEWFGCGCPKLDEFGNVIQQSFNANDVTALFWLVVTVCATVLACILSRRIPQEKLWLRILYVVVIFCVSLVISRELCRMMMWK